MILNEKLIEKDVKLWLRTYAETYCRQATNEITAMASLAINKFYQDYTPKYYDRTLDLLKNSYSPYYHDNGKRIYGGVRISADQMQVYKDGTPAERVVGWTWFQGKHGYKDNSPILTYPPLLMVKEWIQDESFLKKLRINATNTAKRQTYTYLKFK